MTIDVSKEVAIQAEIKEAIHAAVREFRVRAIAAAKTACVTTWDHSIVPCSACDAAEAIKKLETE